MKERFIQRIYLGSPYNLELRSIPTHLKDFNYNLTNYNFIKVSFDPIDIYLRFLVHKKLITNDYLCLIKECSYDLNL